MSAPDSFLRSFTRLNPFSAYDLSLAGNSYVANERNQYTSRTGPLLFELTGAAPAASPVLTAGVIADRSGDYFFQKFPPGDSPTPRFSTFSLGVTPQAQSINGVVSFNYPAWGCPTVSDTLPTGDTGLALQFDGNPFHVGIDKAQHGYTFQNGHTYTFGYWAKTLTGTRTVTLVLTDDVNSGTTSSSFVIDANWQWVSVTKTYASVGANPRCFYTWDGGGQAPFRVYGAQITDITGGTSGGTLPLLATGTPESFGYDDDGNLKSDGRWDYTYDGENRLIEVSAGAAVVAAGYPNQKYAFAYDYLGRRVRKQDYAWSGSALTETTDHRFLYQGWNLIAEYAGAYNSGNFPAAPTVRQFYWGMDLAGPGQQAGGVGGLLLIKEGAASYLPLYDGNGNLHGLLDGSGAIVAAYEYDAFGQTIRETGAYAAKNPFRFSTKYTDIETGLVYYGLRYYSPGMGRFINRDPSGESGGLNLYGFCGNNGVSRWDLLGLAEQGEEDARVRAANAGAGQHLDATLWSFLQAMRASSYRAPDTFGQAWITATADAAWADSSGAFQRWADLAVWKAGRDIERAQDVLASGRLRNLGTDNNGSGYYAGSARDLGLLNDGARAYESLTGNMGLVGTGTLDADGTLTVNFRAGYTASWFAYVAPNSGGNPGGGAAGAAGASSTTTTGAQSLSYKTIVPAQQGANGSLNGWVVQWLLANPSAKGGWIVQHLTVTFNVTDAKGNPVTHPVDTGKWNYWEAWQVGPGGKVTTYAATGDVYDDMYRISGAGPGTRGTVTFTGEARFYEGLNLPSSFVPNNPNTYAGILPATTVDPKLPINNATPPVDHSIVIKW